MKRLIKLISLILSWTFIVPISIISPKKRHQLILIPRFKNSFDGNLKYFFEYTLNDESLKPYFIIDDKETYLILNKKHRNILLYSKLSTKLKMLNSGILIVDGNEWINKYKYFIMFRSFKIQLWHGNGMKHIGLQNSYYTKGIANFIKNKLVGAFPTYDIVMFQSEMQKKNRGNAFNYKNVFINGQPRNDILLKKSSKNDQCLSSDELMIKKEKDNGKTIVVYSPTWRMESIKNQQAFTEKVNLELLNLFCEKNNIIIILKQHQKDMVVINTKNYKNIIKLDRKSDLYPILTLTDLMITDYSSIYIDYLLLNKPIIFFPYDEDSYIDSERQLVYDYNKVTPGPKVYDTRELIQNIHSILIDKKDLFFTEREQVKNLFYKYSDANSSERLVKLIKTRKQINH